MPPSQSRLLHSISICVYASIASNWHLRRHILYSMSTWAPPIMAELEDLFAWNPNALARRSQREVESAEHIVLSRQSAFYDMHLAPHLVCKRLVHVKNLHRVIARIVDEKLDQIRLSGVEMEPPTSPGFYGRTWREKMVQSNYTRARHDMTVREFYMKATSRMCLPVASTLALHPTIFVSTMRWLSVPENIRLGVLAPSLQLGLNVGGMAWKAMSPDVRHRLLQVVRANREDLATWEIQSLETEEIDAMMGVLISSVLDKGEFRWTFCSEVPEIPVESKSLHKIPTDSADTVSLIERCLSDTTEENPKRPEDVLNDSLQRSGSSLHLVREDIKRQEIGSRLGTPVEFSDSEANSQISSNEGPEDMASDEIQWVPPGADHDATQCLIQRVSLFYSKSRRHSS